METGGPPVELQVHDHPSQVGLRFRATDAASGVQLPFVDVHLATLQAWGLRADRAFHERGEAPIELPAGLEFVWTVGHEGYRPVAGYPRDVAWSGRTGVVEVELEPGWGQLLRFADAERLHHTDHRPDDRADGPLALDDCPPVAHVRVYADGEIVSQSAADGLARIQLDRPPAVLEVRHPELTAGGGKNLMLDPQAGQLALSLIHI